MRKDAALSLRIPQKLRDQLDRIARVEGRSLAQVCKALLSGGVESYGKEGPKFLQRYLSRQKKDDVSQ